MHVLCMYMCMQLMLPMAGSMCAGTFNMSAMTLHAGWASALCVFCCPIPTLHQSITYMHVCTRAPCRGLSFTSLGLVFKLCNQNSEVSESTCCVTNIPTPSPHQSHLEGDAGCTGCLQGWNVLGRLLKNNRQRFVAESGTAATIDKWHRSPHMK